MPRIAFLVQAAGNTAAQISRSEHQLQLVRKIYNCWYEEHMRALRNGVAREDIKVDFELVKKKVLLSKPPTAACFPWMLQDVSIRDAVQWRTVD